MVVFKNPAFALVEDFENLTNLEYRFLQLTLHDANQEQETDVLGMNIYTYKEPLSNVVPFKTPEK